MAYATPAGMSFFRPAVQVRSVNGLGDIATTLGRMGAMTTASAAGNTGSAPAAASSAPMSFNWIGDIANAVGGIVNGVIGAATLPDQQRLAQIQAQQAGAYAQAQIQAAQAASERTSTLVMGGLAALVIGGGLLYVLKR